MSDTLKSLSAQALARGRIRPIIDSIKPEVSAGRYPVKRVQGDTLRVEATIVLDGHDLLTGELLYRHEKERRWNSVPLTPHPKQKDVWEAEFSLPELGVYLYAVQARVDRFETWRSELGKKFEAGQDVSVELRVGAELLRQALGRTPPRLRASLKEGAQLLEDPRLPQATRVELGQSESLRRLLREFPDKTNLETYERVLSVTVDRERAAFSAWYEFFPRSTKFDGRTHGTLKDSEKLLPYVQSMGFDVIYLPPIHPLGATNRKGRNNSLTPAPEDPGSPWGIGARSGGHKAIHPELGTLADFRRFTAAARRRGMEIAMDLAFQCSPDHPYVKAHPEWFRRRPDGSIQYAENPPKKYQDIYPFDFESEDWRALWEELLSVILFWVKNGVRIFRVDNPHTKATRFWQWAISEVKARYPDVIFLAEAFTRPAMMYHLAKIGFGQSYTYFTWRHTPAEFRKYLEELTRGEIGETYRPNFWPNTPDILPEHLQKHGRPAFFVRAALAATLSSNYGVYGPAYELCDHTPFKEGGEEYLDSEKYELKAWKLRSRGSLRPYLAALNRIRQANPAFRRTGNIRFHAADQESLLCFTKKSADGRNQVLVVANLDYARPRSGKVALTAADLGVESLEGLRLEPLLKKGGAVKVRKDGLEVKLGQGEAGVEIFRMRAGRMRSPR